MGGRWNQSPFSSSGLAGIHIPCGVRGWRAPAGGRGSLCLRAALCVTADLVEGAFTCRASHRGVWGPGSVRRAGCSAAWQDVPEPEQNKEGFRQGDRATETGDVSRAGAVCCA